MERKQFTSRAGIRAAALLLALALLLAVPAGAVELAKGSHTRWIDRIADLPDYAMTFYEWLEDEAEKGMDGALASPEQDSHYDLGSETFTAEIVYTEGMSEDACVEAAEAEAEALRDARYEEVYDLISEVYNAFLRDHPEVFWLSGLRSVGYSGSSGRDWETNTVYCSIELSFMLNQEAFGFDIREEQYRNTEVLSAAINERETLVETILADCPTEGRYEQVKYLHDWLILNNCYNHSKDLSGIASDCYTCLSALRGTVGTNGPVCEGYSKAFKVLCDRLNIPCVLVDGYAGGAHMWNYVQMEDDKWYAVDVTFDDPILNDEDPAKSGVENWTYFLVGKNTNVGDGLFGSVRTVYNQVSGLCFTNGPVLSETAYDPDNVVLPVITQTLTEADGDVTASYQVPTYRQDEAAYVVLAVYNGAGKLLQVTMEPVSGGTPSVSLSLEGLEDPAQARSFLLDGSRCPMTEAASLPLTTP